jgi:hypothetical protein
MPEERSILGLRFRDPGDNLLRNDQYVGRCLRVDIVDRDTAIVFKFNPRRDLAGDDFLKQCLHSENSSRISATKRARMALHRALGGAAIVRKQSEHHHLQARATRGPGTGELVDPAAHAVILRLARLSPIAAGGANRFAQTGDQQ